MLESFPVCVFVGSVLGFLAGLGVGGGSLLILWLTSVLSIPYPQARIMNLLFFLPCALTASLFRLKKGTLSIKKILPAIVAGCISAVLLYRAGAALDMEWIKKGFGILLVITGVRELCYRPRKSQQMVHRKHNAKTDQ